MAELKFETGKYHMVEYRDLEKFVDEEFGTTNWSFVAAHEANNDSIYDFSAYVDTSMSAQEIREWREELQKNFDEGGGSCYDLFEVLVHEGRLPEGKYLVDVCW